MQEPQTQIPEAISEGVAELVAPVERQVELLQGQIHELHSEIDQLRRRDETLKFYMHRLDEELRLAARLQQDFLPKTLPQVGRVHFHTLFRPAGYVSGDLYDVMRLDERHVGVFMADAVGHGMPAALLTMFIKRALVTKEIGAGAYRLLRPGEAMARLNDSLVEQDLSQATFATAVYGTVNTETLELTFARGGHPSPLLLGKDGELRSVEAEGSLLGIFPGEQYGDASVKLSAGDRVFIYTDGLEIAFSRDQTADVRQWREEIQRRAGMGTAEMLKDLGEHLDRETGSLLPKDDLTMIVVEVK